MRNYIGAGNQGMRPTAKALPLSCSRHTFDSFLTSSPIDSVLYRHMHSAKDATTHVQASNHEANQVGAYTPVWATLYLTSQAEQLHTWSWNWPLYDLGPATANPLAPR